MKPPQTTKERSEHAFRDNDHPSPGDTVLPADDGFGLWLYKGRMWTDGDQQVLKVEYNDTLLVLAVVLEAAPSDEPSSTYEVLCLSKGTVGWTQVGMLARVPE